MSALAEAMRSVDWEGFDSARVREHAFRFSTDVFRKRFVEEVGRVAGDTGARPASRASGGD